jgi:hypothetical protein
VNRSCPCSPSCHRRSSNPAGTSRATPGGGRGCTRDVAKAGNEGHSKKEDGGRPSEVDGDEIDVGRVVEAGDFILQGVQLQPRLTRVTTGFVHHPPLGSGELVGCGHVGEVLPVLEEEKGLGIVVNPANNGNARPEGDLGYGPRRTPCSTRPGSLTMRHGCAQVEQREKRPWGRSSGAGRARRSVRRRSADAPRLCLRGKEEALRAPVLRVEWRPISGGFTGSRQLARSGGDEARRARSWPTWRSSPADCQGRRAAPTGRLRG